MPKMPVLIPNLLSAALLCVLLPLQAAAEGREPAPFTNLQVLPPEIERLELFGIMRGFTEALGVRCEHCHVQDGAEPLPNFDFADDSKAAKETTRRMMRMVEALNATHLSELPTTVPGHAVRLSCATCHRGGTRPAQLRQVLQETLAARGLDEALAQYRRLRQEWWGRGRYDFGEPVLIRLAQGIRQERPDAALAFLELSLEFFPDSAMTHFRRGEIAEELGQRDKALESYRRALDIQPGNPDIAQRIRTLEGGNSDRQ